jgi:hypothetical protein
MALQLKNLTGSVSKIGYLVSNSPTDPQGFVYTTSNSTRAIGVVKEASPYRGFCTIATIGETAKVYVTANVNKNDVIRSAKSNDRVSLGACTVAKTGDAPYLKVGDALNSGKGLISTVLELTYLGGDSGVGYVPYVGATGDVDLGDHLITSGGSHTVSTLDFTYPAEDALSQWWMDGVGGFIASRDWVTLNYLDTFFEGRKLFFGVYSNAESHFYGLCQARDIFKGGSDTNYTNISTSGVQTMVGNARVQCKKIISLDALGRGVTAPALVRLGNFAGYEYDIGDDSYFSFEPPEAWDSSTPILIKVYWYVDEAYVDHSAEVRWQGIYSCVPDNGTEAVDAPTHTGTVNTGDINVPAIAKALTTGTLTIPAASIVADDVIGILFSRIALAGGTNPHSGKPTIVRVEIYYITNKLGKAL